MSVHPLSQYEKLLKRYCLSTVKGLAELEDGAVTRIGGILTKVKKQISRDKEPFATLLIEDIGGTAEIVVCPGVMSKYEKVLVEGTVVLACGQITKNEDEGTYKLFLKEIYPLEHAPIHFARR